MLCVGCRRDECRRDERPRATQRSTGCADAAPSLCRRRVRPLAASASAGPSPDQACRPSWSCGRRESRARGPAWPPASAVPRQCLCRAAPGQNARPASLPRERQSAQAAAPTLAAKQRTQRPRERPSTGRAQAEAGRGRQGAGGDREGARSAGRDRGGGCRARRSRRRRTARTGARRSALGARGSGRRRRRPRWARTPCRPRQGRAGSVGGRRGAARAARAARAGRWLPAALRPPALAGAPPGWAAQ
jgi:hypothetical protein